MARFRKIPVLFKHSLLWPGMFILLAALPMFSQRVKATFRPGGDEVQEKF